MYDIIFNPVAGSGKSKLALKKLKKRLDEKDYTLHITNGIDDACAITTKLNNTQPYTNLIVMGGDGTFNEVLNGITDFDKITLGLIPCGSGNDFIKSLDRDINLDKNLDYILSGNTTYIDYIQASSYRALNCAGTGMDVDTLIAYQNIKVIKGKLRYLLALIKVLIELKFHAIEIEIEGETQEYSVFLAVAGNGNFIGGGMPICPEANPKDGLLDIVFVEEMKRHEVLPMLLRFLKGKHISHPKTTSIRTKSAIIRAKDDNNKMQLDGEIKIFSELRCQVITEKLKIFG